MSEWISVNDRLPEIGERVLVGELNANNVLLSIASLSMIFSDGSVSWNVDDNYWGVIKVMYWMPIPELSKVRGEK